MILLAIPVYATRYLYYEFNDDIIRICPDCKYWISCESDSMYPTIKSCNNTLIAVKPSSRKEIEVGDIIWFRGTEEQTIQYTDNTKYIYHRIIRTDHKGCYITKGDNNDYEDSYHPCFYDIKFKIVGVIYV